MTINGENLCTNSIVLHSRMRHKTGKNTPNRAEGTRKGNRYILVVRPAEKN